MLWARPHRVVLRPASRFLEAERIIRAGDATVAPANFLDFRCAYTYSAPMPRITIYVDEHLARRVRERGIPLSATCQAALLRKVRLEDRRELARTAANTYTDRIRSVNRNAGNGSS